MANSIRYSEGTDTIINTSAKIDSLNDEFFSEYTEFYGYVDGELVNCWRGEDADYFKQKAYEAKPNFERLRDILSEYSSYLKNTANAHEARMMDSKEQAVNRCSFD